MECKNCRKRVIFKGPGAVRTAAFSKDGKRIILLGIGKIKYGYGMQEQERNLPQILLTFQGSKRLLHSPDGTTTAEVSQDGTVLLRDVKTL